MTCSQLKGELEHRGKPWSLSKSFTETELSKLYSEKSDQSGELLRVLSFSFLLQAIIFAIFASLEQLQDLYLRFPLQATLMIVIEPMSGKTSKWNQRVVAGVMELGF